MTDKETWVVWNGSLGILDTVAIGRIERGEGGRMGFLASPYEMVGPFCLDELERTGRIAFGACQIMSRHRWREDQVGLRAEALRARRESWARFDQDGDRGDHAEFRDILDLPATGDLRPADINGAFRRLAKTTHPDAGGSGEEYRRIVDARDALLAALK